MNLFARIWSGVKTLLSLFLPFLPKADSVRRMVPGLLLVLRLLLWAIVLTGLAFLNHYTEARWKWIGGPKLLREWLWLPLFAVLAYFVFWLAWKILFRPKEESYFPDIDEAWDEAVRALDRGGVRLSDAPIFLIFGRPAVMEDPLFQAGQVQLTVRRTPAALTAPLHVYANRDAIYVTCPGASLLGRQAAILAGEGAADVPDQAGDGAADDQFVTMSPRGRAADVLAILERARAEGRPPEQLTDEEKEQMRALAEADANEQAQKRGKQRVARLRDAEKEEFTARLKHLCRLIVRDRRPFIPLNGILLTFSLDATDSDEDARQAGELCHRDLQAAREALQVHCPIIAMFCDLNKAEGFRDFLRQFSTKERNQRVGQRFPLAPEVEPHQMESKVEEAVRWIGHGQLPSWVYKQFRIEPGNNPTEATDVFRGNVRLFRLMNLMRDRQKRLARILARGLLLNNSGPALFGGCYLAGTGKDAADQAFTPGIFRRLVDEQEHISWTAEGQAEEAQNRRLTGVLYGAAVVLVIVAVGLGYLIFQKLR